MDALYDRIGRGYVSRRAPDPRIAARILEALGDSTSVVNIGAGTGSYEPADRRVVAVEPSSVMIRQRTPGAAPVVAAVAEALPFESRSFDAALAVLTVHHWPDVASGLGEMRRVAPLRVVLAFESDVFGFWLGRDYFPAIAETEKGRVPEPEAIASMLGGATRIEPLPVPFDCVDGFLAAYWRRPEMYLDPDVRASISLFATLGDEQLEPGLRRLADDLESGAWDERYGHLHSQESLDVGMRLIVAREQ